MNQDQKSIPLAPIIGLIGWITTLSAAGVGAILVIYDLFSGHASPYTGVLTYMLIPVFLGGGLFFVVASYVMRYIYRKRHSGQPPRLTLDFGNPDHVNRLRIVGLGIVLFGCLSAVGGYQSYHFTESTEFCGITCHAVMTPEYVTYQNSPHAKVACVECHIGAGAEWYVKAKMSGLRQVHAYITDTYELPIETPVANLRPARDTCEQCHWPEKLSGNLEKTYTYFTRDEENTPYSIRLLLKVGGGTAEEASGIHWHVSSGHKIEYLPGDPRRLSIPWVRMTDPNGNQTVYTSEDFDPEILEGTTEIRVMDCMDCHNRPSHVFNDPDDLVNQSMANGALEPSVPNLKDNIMTILEEPYETTELALQAIEDGLREAYSEEETLSATQTESVDHAIEVVKEIYSKNFFPEMGVDWTTHPSFIGHFRWDGCYRCHDGSHVSESGETISHDCNNCHLITGQGEGFEQLGNLEYAQGEFYHPLDMGPLDEGDKCTDCHEAPTPTDYRSLTSSEVALIRSNHGGGK